ncbi:MAG: integrase, partial [Candidatus Azotimanducaceae bacterium]
WDDVLWGGKQISVNKAKVRERLKAPKTNAGHRLIDVDHETELVLLQHKKYKGNTSTIFVDSDTGKSWKDDKKLRVRHWYPALKRAGIEKREPYQTRHTFASNQLSDKRVSPLYLSTQMGHSDCSQIYRTYARWIPNKKD